MVTKVYNCILEPRHRTWRTETQLQVHSQHNRRNKRSSTEDMLRRVTAGPDTQMTETADNDAYVAAQYNKVSQVVNRPSIREPAEVTIRTKTVKEIKVRYDAILQYHRQRPIVDKRQDDITVGIVGCRRSLRDLINLSLTQSEFPCSLKTAQSGSQTNPSNYRPISILPSSSKIFDKVVQTRLINFLNKMDLWDKRQYGFKGSSTEISYPGLYLYPSARKQYVNLGNSESTETETSCGVPRGSILGPILFFA
ncbi:hypothetical protein PR048_013777 [Dryococelus australis]|uniref:Reverse transcriptase n=1 Tax=Dryococelus australis TaxID=614101 RepID=A0ABQ9HT98_9NEOP|nr:hypothetical protein PR048_013777 [Dryococelus australis]